MVIETHIEISAAGSPMTLRIASTSSSLNIFSKKKNLTKSNPSSTSSYPQILTNGKEYWRLNPSLRLCNFSETCWPKIEKENEVKI